MYGATGFRQQRSPSSNPLLHHMIDRAGNDNQIVGDLPGTVCVP
jgi:hypothetical protein